MRLSGPEFLFRIRIFAASSAESSQDRDADDGQVQLRQASGEESAVNIGLDHVGRESAYACLSVHFIEPRQRVYQGAKIGDEFRRTVFRLLPFLAALDGIGYGGCLFRVFPCFSSPA
ncbi:hypothetical protein WP1_280 [Pseudomonas phage WP1]